MLRDLPFRAKVSLIVALKRRFLVIRQLTVTQAIWGYWFTHLMIDCAAKFMSKGLITVFGGVSFRIRLMKVQFRVFRFLENAFVWLQGVMLSACIIFLHTSWWWLLLLSFRPNFWQGSFHNCPQFIWAFSFSKKATAQTRRFFYAKGYIHAESYQFLTWFYPVTPGTVLRAFGIVGRCWGLIEFIPRWGCWMTFWGEIRREETGQLVYDWLRNYLLLNFMGQYAWTCLMSEYPSRSINFHKLYFMLPKVLFVRSWESFRRTC